MSKSAKIVWTGNIGGFPLAVWKQGPAFTVDYGLQRKEGLSEFLGGRLDEDYFIVACKVEGCVEHA